MADVPSFDIVLVEDTQTDAELTIRSLKKNHLANSILHLDDGAAALEFFSQDPRPRLVILDLKLPKVDGLEILKKIKGTEATRTVPVIVLTSSKEESDIVASYNLGANSYIVKPVDFQKFSDAVREAGLYWLLLNESPHGNLR